MIDLPGVFASDFDPRRGGDRFYLYGMLEAARLRRRAACEYCGNQ